MKLLEYIAAKRPIVAPRLPSILDLLDESEFYSYEANSVEDCASAIKEALESNAGSRRLPRLERLDQYSWEKRNERILNFIEDKFA
jgi:glycosyltransferase involved in cell wall biosynthesis